MNIRLTPLASELLQVVHSKRAESVEQIMEYALEALAREEHVDAPAWLLSQLFLKHGVFNNDRTAVICGSETLGTFSIDLTKRADWEGTKKRLADEGF
jgi:hypothetical protein